MKFTFALSVISDLKHLLTPENPLSLTYYPFMKQLIPPNNPPINPKQTMHYYPIDIDKIQQIKNNSKISILSVNIRSLNTNYDFISQLIDNCHQPNIILIQETWNPDKDKSIFENYNQPTLNMRKNRNGGGSGIWTHIKHKSHTDLTLTRHAPDTHRTKTENTPNTEYAHRTHTAHAPHAYTQCHAHLAHT